MAQESIASSSLTTSRLHNTNARTVAGTNRMDTEDDFDFVPNTAIAPESEFQYDASLEINGRRSLANIGLQAFWLGFAFATSLITGILFAFNDYQIWRFFAFLTCLSVFHFLEYWTTARFNLPAARSSSFLLFTNGAAYNVAYLLAMSEILLSSLLFSTYADWMTNHWSRALGLFLVLLGQSTRSVAMAQAGTNFNHTPQKIRKKGHVLVTSGVYAFLRHPSYFGFFWWAVGTQLLTGNKFCVIGYALILWRFFYKRIVAEERTLVDFFGRDYEAFRAKTPIGIPFIR